MPRVLPTSAMPVLHGLDHLARGADRLGEGSDDELETARLGPRPPRGEDAVAGGGVAVDQDVADVDRADAVDEAVVGLGDDREAVLGQTFDEVDLPERARAVQRPGLDAGDELFELLVGARSRQGAAPHVVAHVELLVVHPHRVREATGNGLDLLAVARDVGDPLADQRHEALVVEAAFGRVEHHHRADVHRRRRVLEVQERGVQGAEPVYHGPIVSDRPARRPGRAAAPAGAPTEANSPRPGARRRPRERAADGIRGSRSAAR